MNKEDYIKELEQRNEKHEIQIKHLKNDLDVTKKEYEESIRNNYDLYSKIEEKVNERTKELQNIQTELESKTIELEKEKEASQKTKNKLVLSKQAQSDFFGKFSHDIKTPLSVLLGFTELLKDKIKSGKNKDYLDAIIKSGEDLMLLIKDMVDISRIDAGKRDVDPDPVNILSILKSAENNFRLEAEEQGIEFEVEISPKFPKTIMINRISLLQILKIIIGNAIKYTESGSVKLFVNSKTDLPLSSTVNIQFEVKDTGRGISVDKLEKILNTLGQKENSEYWQFEGIGIGLSITKRLVNLMGGNISVSSKLNEGSSFLISFNNLNVEDPETTVGLKIESTPSNQIKQKILLIDDDMLTLKALKHFQDEFNCEISAADNGESAVQKAHSFKPDIIFVDLNLPGMNGTEIIKLLKEHKEFQKTIFIVVSGFCDEQTIKDIKNAGANDYISKPIHKNDFLNVINKYLISNIDKSKEIKKESVSKNQLKKMKNIAKKLDGEYKKEWELVSGSMVISEIEKFAQKIFTAGSEQKLDYLAEWGENIQKHASSFRIDLLNNSLAKFPEISNITIKKIKQFSAN